MAQKARETPDAPAASIAPQAQARSAAKKDRREARLAAELRTNLKRRKAAARGKEAPDVADETPEKSEP